MQSPASEAIAINEKGQVLGRFNEGKYSETFLWNQIDGIKIIAPISNSLSCYPVKFNDNGQIIFNKAFKDDTHYIHSDIKPSLITQKRDELLSGLTYKGTIRSSTTVVRYLASLSHAFAIAVKDWEWIRKNSVMKISKPKISNGRTRFLNDDE